MLPERVRARPGLGVLLAALAVEFADEFFDGTKSAAIPLIRHDLNLSYAQVGMLAAVPLVLGGLLELPVGVLAGSGRRRRRFILAGGVVFTAAVLTAASAGSFGTLLVALTIFFPASGAFVGLTQSAVLDSAPARRAQQMMRWTVAGSAGAVAGPLVLTAVLAAGGTWRLAFVLVGAASGVSLLAVYGATGQHPRSGGRAEADRTEPGRPEAGRAQAAGSEAGWPGWRSASRIVCQSGAVRWLALLQVADLLLDVFTAFVAVYLVSVAHASPATAALGIAIRLGAGLAGDLVLIRPLEQRDPRRVLRAGAWLALAAVPAFLLAPGLWVKLICLAVVTLGTAPWYPVLTAELFGSLAGRSGLAVSLSSVAGMAGGAGPLALGLLAQRFGLGWAMAGLAAVPLVMLAGSGPMAGRRTAAG